jgi:hypothetical protein
MPARDLYHDAVKTALTREREGINFLVQSSQIKFFVVNIDNQEIVQWLS